MGAFCFRSLSHGSFFVYPEASIERLRSFYGFGGVALELGIPSVL